MGNAVVVGSIIAQLLQEALQYQATLNQANSENRDITDAELAQIQAQYDGDDQKLSADIAAASKG